MAYDASHGLRIVAAKSSKMAQAENARKERLQRFIAQFDPETVPACDEGMALLLAFAEASPSAYELARHRGFNVPQTLFDILPLWQDFKQHVATCAKCKER